MDRFDSSAFDFYTVGIRLANVHLKMNALLHGAAGDICPGKGQKQQYAQRDRHAQCAQQKFKVFIHGLFLKTPPLLQNHRRGIGSAAGIKHRQQRTIGQFHRGGISQIGTANSSVGSGAYRFTCGIPNKRLYSRFINCISPR